PGGRTAGPGTVARAPAGSVGLAPVSIGAAFRPGIQLGPAAGAADGRPAGALDASLALEARGISFSYARGVRVLDDVDLVVRRGTVHGLIGPNGSGKSTLVDILSGALFPESGTITINGRRAERLPSWRRVDLGLMRSFQTAMMVDELSTRDNVSIGLYNRFSRIGLRSLAWPMIPSARRDSRAMAAAAVETLDAVGVRGSWARTRVADVPHGVEQLTQLAAVCVGRPSVVILDEPLAGLSTEEIAQVESILRDLGAAGVTIVVVEHQTRFIFDVCEEVTVLAAGRVVKSGPAAEVRVDTRVREVYLGQ
ncbi:MAG: ABC transporter ATP-binding protein, partial [Acidimicrobiales bacterium]